MFPDWIYLFSNFNALCVAKNKKVYQNEAPFLSSLIGQRVNNRFFARNTGENIFLLFGKEIAN